MLNVEWPSIALVNVPTHLETYSNDIEIKAKFTTNLCSQMVVSPIEKNVANKKRTNDVSAGSRVPHQLPFKTYLELIRCPPQMNTGRYSNTLNYDCQVCSNRRDPFLHLEKTLKKPDIVFISITCYFVIYRLLQVMETQEYGFRSESPIYTVVARIESLLIVLFGAREEPFEYF